jgi:hypothetical protein
MAARRRRKPGSDPDPRALEALSLMRPKKQPNGTVKPALSRNAALREVGMSPGPFMREVGTAVVRKPSGRYVALPRDRIRRRMRIETTEGSVVAVIPSSTQASLNARHANAIKRYLETGDSRRLARFRKKTVAGYTLETDPNVLDARARADDIDTQDLYERTR